MIDSTIKQGDSSWKNGMAKNITFIVTKDCQLACKYCYLVGKNSKERMHWEVAKLAVDYILGQEKIVKKRVSYGISLAESHFLR